MGKEPETLDLLWIIKEKLYMLLSFIAPLLIFAGSIYFLINQQRYGLTTFFISLAVAFFTTIYMIIFLIRRMIFKFKEGKILQHEKAIVKKQSKKELAIGFLLFLSVVVSLFVTAALYGTEKGPFIWIMAMIGLSIQLAVMYSLYIILKESGLNVKILKLAFIALLIWWLLPLILYLLKVSTMKLS